MRLRVGETWLLKRLMKHAWEYGDEVYVSKRKIVREAHISPATLRRHFARLEALGYIRRVSEGTLHDNRVRYALTGIYAALAICVACDPRSRWAQDHGVLDPETVRTLVHVDPREPEISVGFDLGLASLDSGSL